ncbi:hypothetical protein KEM48_008025 [Puccinia striiformis f. sp. tritici PST-130]|nr:hypothetical protein KEM48_008025 [Puccinia striiformis f. sp. tritici PST-130]
MLPSWAIQQSPNLGDRYREIDQSPATVVWQTQCLIKTLSAARLRPLSLDAPSFVKMQSHNLDARTSFNSPTSTMRWHKRDANFFAVKKGDDLIFKTTEASEAVAGGDGVCGNYDTNVVLGCVFGQVLMKLEKIQTKWLDQRQLPIAVERCTCIILLVHSSRAIEVWRASTPDKKITAKVVDGCGLKAKAFKVGCENLFLTKKLLTTLDPAAVGEISDLKWQFEGKGISNPGISFGLALTVIQE